MANDIYFLYQSDDLKKLIDDGAVTIKAFSKLRRGVIDGRSVAIMDVGAQGFDRLNRPVGVAPGCPCPPCTAKNMDQFN